MPNILFFLSFFRAFFFLFTKKAAAGFAGVCYYLSPTFHIEKHWNPIFFFTNLPLNPSIKTLCSYTIPRRWIGILPWIPDLYFSFSPSNPRRSLKSTSTAVQIFLEISTGYSTPLLVGHLTSFTDFSSSFSHGIPPSSPGINTQSSHSKSTAAPISAKKH